MSEDRSGKKRGKGSKGGAGPAIDKAQLLAVMKAQQDAYAEAKAGGRDNWNPGPGTFIVKGAAFDVGVYADKKTNESLIRVCPTCKIVAVAEGDEDTVGKTFQLGFYSTKESQIGVLKGLLAAITGETSDSLHLDIQEAESAWVDAYWEITGKENGEYMNYYVNQQVDGSEFDGDSDEGEVDGDADAEPEVDPDEDDEVEAEVEPKHAKRGVAKLPPAKAGKKAGKSNRR